MRLPSSFPVLAAIDLLPDVAIVVIFYGASPTTRQTITISRAISNPQIASLRFRGARIGERRNPKPCFYGPVAASRIFKGAAPI